MTAHNPRHQAGAGYLWDSSGPHDAEIVRLERALGPLRRRPEPFVSGRASAPHERMGLRPVRMSMRAAAALALFIAGVWAGSLFSTAVEDVGTIKEYRNTMAAAGSLEVIAIDGEPRIGGQRFTGSGSLRAGQWVETDVDSQVQVEVAGYGTVKVEPDSRLRLVHTGKDEHRMELKRGALTAYISAPPRLFIVDTPAATAVDLGCAYRLTVDDSGNGMIEVTMGWVSMEIGGKAEPSIVPRGAMCVTRKGLGAGTPFYADASSALRRALEQFDFENGGDSALQIVLNESREADSLTLWHLLSRTSGDDRGRVFDLLASFAPRPDGITRERVMRGDTRALVAWRDTFIWSPSPPTPPVK